MSDGVTPKHQDKKRVNLSVVGLIGTGAYILGLVGFLFLFAKYGWISLGPLELNQIGDLLAGLFGPLAIFWLVLGFFQQGEELRNSVETLKLQAKELSLSVEQQRELVTVTKETLDHERKIAEQSAVREQNARKPRPLVSMKGVMSIGTRIQYDFAITNAGYPASNARATLSMDGATLFVLQMDYWEQGKKLVRQNFSAPNNRFDRPLDLFLEYIEEDGSHNQLIFKLSPPNLLEWGNDFSSKLVSNTRSERN